MLRLDGKTAIVTGAGRSLGPARFVPRHVAETPVDQAITEAYTEAGARIVPCAFPSSSALASRQM